MKNEDKFTDLEKKIKEIIDELDKKLADNNIKLSSAEIVELSQQLDDLIVTYLLKLKNKNTDQ